jgi:predicted acylesterase/phospholipase RssA/CRP-like cAMP-binding protein
MLPLARLTELSSAALLRNLDGEALGELRARLEPVFLPGGKTLFHAGDAGDSMYVIIAGRLRIFAAGNGGVGEAIRELGRGESVGELALVTGMPRSATARAIRDTELARLSRAAYDDICKKHPALANELLKQIAWRQSQGADRSLSKRQLRTLALMPFDDQAPTADFARLLGAALQELGSTLHLTARSDLRHAACDGNPDTEPTTITQRLTELESCHRFVIYQADVELSPWTEQCVRQADLILLIAAANCAPAKSRREQLAQYFSGREAAPEIELVLLHGASFDARVQADRQLAGLPIRDFYHVVEKSQADFARLARFLTGSAVGLVLSGGGARGFAHIGILRAFQEHRIPVDFIGGTSMGAVIAAQYAAGWDWQTMCCENRRHWPRCHPQRNYTLPLVALNSGKRMDRMLKEMFGDREIENLPGKFFCVSTNLTRADAMVHRAGALWKAVRASVSIPGIGPPAIENGEIFVDGGLVNNLPVDVMKHLCQGAVCAVDVSEQVEFKSSLPESYSVSGWQLLWRRLNPLATTPDLPNIFHILYRTTTVGSLRAIESIKADADLYLNPPVGNFGIFDWNCVDKIIEAGYRYGLRTLEAREDEIFHLRNGAGPVPASIRGVDKSSPPRLR